MNIQEKFVLFAILVMTAIFSALILLTAPKKAAISFPTKEKPAPKLQIIPQKGDSFFPESDKSLEEKTIKEETLPENS